MKVLDHVLAVSALSLFRGCGEDPISPPADPQPDPDPRQPTALVCASTPANLLAWWPGDGTAEDIAGDAHGTASGGASFVAGNVGETFDLSGRLGVRGDLGRGVEGEVPDVTSKPSPSIRVT